MDGSSAGAVPGVLSSSFVELRHASTDHALFVIVPERRFLAIDGVGAQQADDYSFAASVLRDAMHALRSRLPRDPFSGRTHAVDEALWWPPIDTPAREIPTRFVDRSDWRWRQMAEVPTSATDEAIDGSIEDVRRASGRATPLVRDVSLVEGAVAQILHVGGHGSTAATVSRLFGDIAAAGYRPIGSLHILLLADPDRVPPGRGRAIIRQPII